MIGNWKWNAGLAGFSFVLAFLFSFENNTLFVSLVRSGYSFLLFYFISFIPRFLLAGLNAQSQGEESGRSGEKPAGEDHNEEDFEPFVVADITKASQAVRQWSNE